MNALTRIDPIDRLVPEFFRRFGFTLCGAEDTAGEIRLDITEKDKQYDVRAEIPGAKKKDIRVQVDGNFVSITAEVRQEREESSDGRVVLKETSFGSMSRGFSLGHEVDAKAVAARFEDGVLRLTLPKREGGAGRVIEIQ